MESNHLSQELSSGLLIPLHQGYIPGPHLSVVRLYIIWRRREGLEPSMADLESAVFPTTLTTLNYLNIFRPLIQPFGIGSFLFIRVDFRSSKE